MRVTAFTKYGPLAASTRQRILQYIPALKGAGISLTYHSLLGQAYVRSLATGVRYSRTEVARSYIKRLREVAVGTDCDIIWIYAELFPYLPGWFEELVFRSGKPVIYDFDDAFFHMYDDTSRPFVKRLLGGKLRPLLKGAAACCCGNEYLLEYASQFCERSIILPTVVNTELYYPAAHSSQHSRQLTIGWIGSPSTWPYVRSLMPLLQKLAQEYGLRVRVVGAGAKAEGHGFPELELIEWREETEIDEVRKMDIGIMPLPDEEWAKGKSGYKLIQYMACGLPVVASPVGVNSTILEGGEVGFLATGPEEWRHALVRLISDGELRKKMGAAGRRRVESDYSLQRHAPRLVDLFKSLALK